MINDDYLNGEKNTKDNLLEIFSNKFNIDIFVARLLYIRGIDSEEKAERFLTGGKKYFSDPYKIGGVKGAVERINSAIENDESIIIYGDYDADGICSVAILYLYLKEKGVNVDLYIPDRAEGYGINIEAVEKIAEEFFPDLIITCDCGIMAQNEIEYIMSLGIDVIVTDHHEPGNIVPDCIIINPKLGIDDDLKNLCGAGVALKLIQAIAGAEKASEYLDIAAIATIADSVPLTGENRDIVKEGLKLLNTCERPGLCALAKTFNLKEDYSSATLAFMIAPRINAAGRIGAAERAIVLFTESDEAVLEKTANDLNLANCERQEICEEITNKILHSKEFKEQIYNPILIIYGETFPTGILGIVASKLAERFCRPVFLFTKADDLLKGSGRSVAEVNLFEMLTSMQDLFVKYGGHNQAAGITMERCNFEEFINSCNRYLEKFIYDSCKKEYDLELESSRLNLKFAKDLCLLEPFGIGNKRPRFLIENKICEITPMKNYLSHLIIKAGDKNITAFNFSDKAELLSCNFNKNLIIDVSVNCYNNKESPKYILKNIIVKDDLSGLEDIIFARYLNSFNKKINKSLNYSLIDELKEYSKGQYGKLLITFNAKTFTGFSNCNFEKVIFNDVNKNNNNKIILSPNLDMDFSLYNEIILLEKLNDNFIAELNSATSAAIYIVNKTAAFDKMLLDGIDFDRKTFVKYYKLIAENVKDFTYLNDICYIYNYFKNIDDTIKLIEFSICFNTFTDLKLLTLDAESGRIETNNIKVDLEKSGFLKKVKDLNLA